MNKILILKDVAYAAVSSGGAIATIADIERLALGAIAAFDQDGAVIAHASLSGTYENIYFAVGVANGADGTVYNNLTVPIPVVVDKWDQEDYQAPVKPVVQVGALITKQVDSMTLAGTTGTATVTGAGESDTITWNTDLATTASDFVTANAAAYLAAGVTLTFTSTGATNGVLVFTAVVGGTAFVSPVLSAASDDLVGTVVNTTANITGTTLIFDTTGDYYVNVFDNSFTNKFPTQRVDASGYRQTYMSEEDVVDDVVTKLNATGVSTNEVESFVVATKTGNSTDGWGISITPKEDGILMNVAVGGMFEGTPVYSDGTKGSTVQVFGFGVSTDVLQMEKDFSVFVGNSNSIEYTDEYFSVPTETVSGALYEMINLAWKGTTQSPSTKKTVMNNRLVIAGVDGSTVMDNIQTILTGILTTTGSKIVS